MPDGALAHWCSLQQVAAHLRNVTWLLLPHRDGLSKGFCACLSYSCVFMMVHVKKWKEFFVRCKRLPCISSCTYLQTFRSVWVLCLQCASVQWAHALPASWTSGGWRCLAACRKEPVHISICLSSAFVKSWSECVACKRGRWNRNRVCDTGETCMLLGMHVKCEFISLLAHMCMNFCKFLKGTDFRKYYTGISNYRCC